MITEQSYPLNISSVVVPVKPVWCDIGLARHGRWADDYERPTEHQRRNWITTTWEQKYLWYPYRSHSGAPSFERRPRVRVTVKFAVARLKLSERREYSRVS